MWTLEGYRIIQSVGGWIAYGEYKTISGCLKDVVNMYALEYRITSPQGETHCVKWVDDPHDPEYTIPTLGEVCNHWPKIVGNVRG